METSSSVHDLRSWARHPLVRPLYATVDDLAALPAGVRTPVIMPELSAFIVSEIPRKPQNWPAELTDGVARRPRDYFRPLMHYVTRPAGRQLDLAGSTWTCVPEGHTHEYTDDGINLTIEERLGASGYDLCEPREVRFEVDTDDPTRVANLCASGDCCSRVILLSRLERAGTRVPYVCGGQVDA